MKSSYEKYLISFKLSVACSFISSLSIVFLAFYAGETKMTVPKLLVALVFWIGLIAEQILFWKANSMRKKMLGEKSKGKIGLLSICKNKFANAADIVLLVSLILLILFAAFGILENIVQYILCFIIILSFRLHCILNGQNFSYINNKKEEGKKNVKQD